MLLGVALISIGPGVLLSKMWSLMGRCIERRRDAWRYFLHIFNCVFRPTYVKYGVTKLGVCFLRFAVASGFLSARRNACRQFSGRGFVGVITSSQGSRAVEYYRGKPRRVLWFVTLVRVIYSVLISFGAVQIAFR